MRISTQRTRQTRPGPGQPRRTWRAGDTASRSRSGTDHSACNNCGGIPNRRDPHWFKVSIGVNLLTEKHVHFECVYFGADFFNDTYAFMTEDHVGGLVVLVGATQTCVRDSKENLVAGKGVLVPSGLGDLSGLMALVHGVIQIQLHGDSLRTIGVWLKPIFIWVVLGMMSHYVAESGGRRSVGTPGSSSIASS